MASCFSVLMVEDDRPLGLALSRVLSRRVELTLVSTLREAQPLLLSHLWDGFLIDVRLPDGSGVELLHRIRRHHHVEPIIVMTGGDLRAPGPDVLMCRAVLAPKPLPHAWCETFPAWLRTARAGSEAELRARLRDLELSPREIDVVIALAQGVTAQLAGLRLGISKRTVESHCLTVYRRLGVGSLVELLALANRWDRE